MDAGENVFIGPVPGPCDELLDARVLQTPWRKLGTVHQLQNLVCLRAVSNDHIWPRLHIVVRLDPRRAYFRQSMKQYDRSSEHLGLGSGSESESELGLGLGLGLGLELELGLGYRARVRMNLRGTGGLLRARSPLGQGGTPVLGTWLDRECMHAQVVSEVV